MADSKPIPEGWMKKQSKSRPGKFYFVNSKLNLSVWNIDDIDNYELVKAINGKRRSYGNNKKTPEKVINGTSQHSKAIRKNIANDRMKKLQKSLKSEIEQNGDSYTKKPATSKVTASSTPVKIESKKNIASKRLEKIRTQLNKEVKIEQAKSDVAAASVSNSAKELFQLNRSTEKDVEMMDISFEGLPDPGPDDMEWEEIPEETVKLIISEMRLLDNHQVKHNQQPLDIKTPSPGPVVEFYIVVDTNVLISHLNFVKNIKGKYYNDLGKATIYLPYIVLNELDSLKTRDDKNLSRMARNAVNFINNCFESRDPFLAGQRALQNTERIIRIDSADDEVLNCCLQIKRITKNIILLTNDNNLRNKAHVNKVETFSRDLLQYADFNVKLRY